MAHSFAIDGRHVTHPGKVAKGRPSNKTYRVSHKNKDLVGPGLIGAMLLGMTFWLAIFHFVS